MKTEEGNEYLKQGRQAKDVGIVLTNLRLAQHFGADSREIFETYLDRAKGMTSPDDFAVLINEAIDIGFNLGNCALLGKANDLVRERLTDPTLEDPSQDHAKRMYVGLFDRLGKGK